jgi:16S rRNA A1518/A1519 N6-dimethyltransferase RsmA/KsgA/DIM1 with predicted DNA glycosylase/AP lyase activity
MTWLIIILLIVIIYAFFFLAQFYNIILNRAPFITTDREIIKKIISELFVPEQATVYELGCGQAMFLRLLEKKFTKINLIGVENLFLVYLFDKIKFNILGSKIEILHKNIFDINLKDADFLYCYLSDEIMDKMVEKFKRECKVGTKVISCVFTLRNFTPYKVITVNNDKIYFYEI